MRGAVDVSGVTKRFGTTTAVDRLDLAVAPGEFVALLGPSGCGKTTTLRMLAGFSKPDEGCISISGQRVDDVPPYRRDVNTVFQDYALFPHMTVGANVAYGLRRAGVERSAMQRRVDDALDMVKMRAFSARRPRQLSGGQQQRVALARALVNRPAVLLLDEPLGSLDRQLRQDMQVELRLLQAELDTTFVFVTHDQEEAMSMADRVAVMVDGRIEQIAEPHVIYDEPASAFVAGFIGRNNFFSGRLLSPDAFSGEQVAIATERRFDHLVSIDRVVATVRPEAVTMTDDDPGPGPNRVAGHVVGVANFGDAIQYIVRSGPHEILVRRPRSGPAGPKPGDSVWCTWSPDAPRLFQAQ